MLFGALLPPPPQLHAGSAESLCDTHYLFERRSFLSLGQCSRAVDCSLFWCFGCADLRGKVSVHTSAVSLVIVFLHLSTNTQFYFPEVIVYIYHSYTQISRGLP